MIILHCRLLLISNAGTVRGYYPSEVLEFDFILGNSFLTNATHNLQLMWIPAVKRNRSEPGQLCSANIVQVQSYTLISIRFNSSWVIYLTTNH